MTRKICKQQCIHMIGKLVNSSSLHHTSTQKTGSSRSLPAVIMWCNFKQKTLTHIVIVAFHYCFVVVTVSDNLYRKKITNVMRKDHHDGESSVNFPQKRKRSIHLCEWEPESDA